jgi:hypothetical protein
VVVAHDFPSGDLERRTDPFPTVGNLVSAAPAKVGNFGEFWGIDPLWAIKNRVVQFPIMVTSPSIPGEMHRQASLARRSGIPAIWERHFSIMFGLLSTQFLPDFSENRTAPGSLITPHGLERTDLLISIGYPSHNAHAVVLALLFRRRNGAGQRQVDVRKG